MSARAGFRMCRGATVALGLGVPMAGGCATQRTTVVELIGGLDGDADTHSADASIDASEGGAASPSCTSPAFVTSSPNGIWSNGGYFVFNNMWNAAAVPGSQTLYACSYHSWYVVSDQNDDAGAVETYPNVQMNFNTVPIGSLHGVTSTFAEAGPHVGIYEYAYDIWLNGVATAGSTQILIWVDNSNRVPSGTQVATTTLGGRTYDIWKTSDGFHVVFAATVAFASGTVDLLEIVDWTVNQGWLPSSSTLGQIDFGVEIVSSGGAGATYEVNDLSLATQ